jgi:hypothetical protein
MCCMFRHTEITIREMGLLSLLNLPFNNTKANESHRSRKPVPGPWPHWDKSSLSLYSSFIIIIIIVILVIIISRIMCTLQYTKCTKFLSYLNWRTVGNSMFQLGTQNEVNCVTFIISQSRSPKCFSFRVLFTHSLTPWSRVLLKKLTGSQLVKKFSAFYGSARHLSLPWTSWIQSMPPYPISWRSILILSSNLRLVLPIGLLPLGFPTNTLRTHLPHTCYMPIPSHPILLALITQNLGGGGSTIKIVYLCIYNRSHISNMPHQYHLLNLNISFARWTWDLELEYQEFL